MMRMNLLRRYVLVLVVLTLTGLSLWTGVAGASGGLVNPSSNVSPQPDFQNSGWCSVGSTALICPNPCFGGSADVASPVQAVWTADPACTSYVLAAVNHARSLEGVKALVLPSNWDSLSVPEQLFVVADLERVDRGYPPYLGLNAVLSADAQQAAVAQVDPTLAVGFPGIGTLGSTWAGGGSNVLFADYVWMYDDGWGGSLANTFNLDCVSATSPDCWGHRDELLGVDPAPSAGVGLMCSTCEFGAGSAVVTINGTSAMSYTDLVEGTSGTIPAMTFTWASELPYFTTPWSSSGGSGSGGSTTTTVPAVPARITVTAPRLTLSSVRVHWGAQGVTGVTRVRLVVYRGTRCSGHAVHQIVRRYSGRVVGDNLSAGGARWFAGVGPYVGRVYVSTAHGTYASTCTSLGRS